MRRLRRNGAIRFAIAPYDYGPPWIGGITARSEETV
jgi:hypothetical protein